jgi:tight adherence protein B
MLRVVLAALATAAEVPLGVVAGLWLASLAPVVALAAVGVWVSLGVRRRRAADPGPDDEAALLHGLAAEAAGGAAPRAALVAAASRAPRLDLRRAVRLAGAGMPAGRVAPELESALPLNGRLVAGAWLLAARSGGPAGWLFQTLAARSAEVGELRRERRALTAQARASAWVVAGLPVALLGGLAMSGRLTLGDPALRGIVLVGLTLQALGVGLVIVMVRRAR